MGHESFSMNNVFFFFQTLNISSIQIYRVYLLKVQTEMEHIINSYLRKPLK